jgi:hypothetical protein
MREIIATRSMIADPQNRQIPPLRCAPVGITNLSQSLQRRDTKYEGGLTSTLFCEELADVGECLELECVACGIKKEHGGLFAGFAFEADVGLDDKDDACPA